MLECVRYLEKLLPVPKKDTLDQYRENYSSGHAIENIMNSHSQIENAGDEQKKMKKKIQKTNSIFIATKGWKAPMLKL